MKGISLLIIITRREDEENYAAFLRRKKLPVIHSVPCQGTAGQRILNLLGLEKTGKTLLFFMTDCRKAARVMREMVSDMGINMPGNGIALRVPVGSVGGASSMKYLMENQNYIIGEVADMEEKQQFPYDLIIAIAERGSAEKVMAAARSANAGGGTIVRAKAIGGGQGGTFMGVSIAAEKEMLLIVTRSEGKAAIMRAIMEQAGIHTDARTVLFSLPVEDVAGLTSVMKPEAEEE